MNIHTMDGVLYTSGTYMYTEGQMRPKIPEYLVNRLDKPVDEYKVKTNDGNKRSMYFYEIGGYQSKGDFIRDAIREKIERHSDKHDF